MTSSHGLEDETPEDPLLPAQALLLRVPMILGSIDRAVREVTKTHIHRTHNQQKTYRQTILLQLQNGSSPMVSRMKHFIHT